FQTFTNITYKSKGGHVLIQIFDIQGRLMRTVVDKISNAGEHAITFDNPGYSPGLYYARFQNEELQQVRTMMIAR
ncbi:MAG: T9SS type A sorting domain-containing protein, partial [Daejeonella sp.]